MTDPPIYVNCRDRVTHLRQLVAWLERAGHERIVLLDNASTYEPLLEFYASTPHQVVRLGRNVGARSLFDADLVPAERFVYTDPDVVPLDDCPLDAVTYLQGLLDRYPEFPKAGLGLHLDDVAADMPSLSWEQGPEIHGPLVEPTAYRSLIDTTFALYRPAARFEYAALRTVGPYEARHMSWYAVELSAEDRYYLEHAIPGPDGSSWAQLHQGDPECLKSEP